jgi:hypothetical protein
MYLHACDVQQHYSSNAVCLDIVSALGMQSVL